MILFIFGRPFVKRFAICYRSVVLSVLSFMSVTLVYSGGWPNGWIDQDETTWRAGIGLGPGNIVLDEDPAPPPKRDTAPQFSAHICCDQMAGWIKMPLGRELGLGPSDIVLDRNPAPLHKKGAPMFGPCLLWPNGRPSQLLPSTCYSMR